MWEPNAAAEQVENYRITYGPKDGNSEPENFVVAASETPVATLTGIEYNKIYNFEVAAISGDLIESVPSDPVEYGLFLVGSVDLDGHATWSGGGSPARYVEYGDGASAPRLNVEVPYTFVGWSEAFSSVTGESTLRALYDFDGLRVPLDTIRAIWKNAPVAGEPSGTNYRLFGIPAIDDGNRLAFQARITDGHSSVAALLVGEEPRVVVRQGQSAPGFESERGVFRLFRDPIIAYDATNVRGALAFQAKVSGVPRERDEGLWVDFGMGSGIELIARKGAQPPGMNGVVWKAFGSMALSETAVAFNAKLSAVSGASKLPSNLDDGIWIAMNGSAPVLAIREGDRVGGKVVKQIQALRPLGLATGHGKGLVGDCVVAKLIFTDRAQDIVQITPGQVVSAAAGVDVGSAPYPSVMRFKKLGPPTQGAARTTAFMGELGVSFAAGQPAGLGVFAGKRLPDAGAIDLFQVAGKSDPVKEISGTQFLNFKDPVTAADSKVAFLGIMSGSGVNLTNRQGIWYSAGGSEVVMRARQRSEAPSTGGGQFKTFSAMGLPDGEGDRLLFVAKLEQQSAVDSSNDRGLWVADSTGLVRLALREGDVIGGYTVNRLKWLEGTFGSPGQTRSFNSIGKTVGLVDFRGGSRAVVRLDIP
jgi:hypothetical protein